MPGLSYKMKDCCKLQGTIVNWHFFQSLSHVITMLPYFINKLRIFIKLEIFPLIGKIAYRLSKYVSRSTIGSRTSCALTEIKSILQSFIILHSTMEDLHSITHRRTVHLAGRFRISGAIKMFTVSVTTYMVNYH